MADVGTNGREPAKNVIEALCRVMEDLPGIGRDNKSEQGYSYRGLEAITAEAQRLFAKHHVVFVPRVLSRQVKDLTINSRPWTQDEAEILYTVYGPGGIEDHIEVGPLIGLGRDNSDKGMNKATSQAFKYALLQTLCIGDAKDDADRDHAHEADAPPADEGDWFQANGWESQAAHDAAREALTALLRSEQMTDAARNTFKAWLGEIGMTMAGAKSKAQMLAMQARAEDLAGRQEPLAGVAAGSGTFEPGQEPFEEPF